MNASRRRFLTVTTSTTALSAGAGCTSLLDETSDEKRDADEGNGGDGDRDTNESTSGLAPDDWPSFQRTARNDGYSPSTAPTDEPTERWSTTLSGTIDEQVAVVDGTVYAATDDGIVHALDAASGDKQWTESLEGGRSQCPCFVNGLVVVGTDTGELVALSATDGTREWTAQLAGPVSGPTAAGGTVYVGTGEEPTAAAIDAATGDELWSTPLAVDADDYPAVDGAGVYVGAQDGWDGRVYALEAADGSDRWEYDGTRMQPPTVAESGVLAPFSTIEVLPRDDGSRRQIGITGEVLASPAATPDLTVYGTDLGFVGAVSHERDGSDAGWGRSVGQYAISAPAVTDAAVYVTMIGPELFALDVEVGTVLWSRSLEGTTATAPTVADGAVFVGTDEGRLVALE
ncbi:PQQ-binding-like beta-propeller repeat protein [Natrinema marinum]|uniref:outer membrane protein assembly factor BamB family protein n=1 Tax=Natrinema marinum TaxID=2961598 RepID=UPI0020C8530D|nr:PQQ-binding-like beta-propeller repeat protein [Natrinema marinum]